MDMRLQSKVHDKIIGTGPQEWRLSLMQKILQEKGVE